MHEDQISEGVEECEEEEVNLGEADNEGGRSFCF
jgi:hypothetical protein